MKKLKTIQYFTPEYLENCKTMTPGQIVQFLEDFRQLCSLNSPEAGKSKLISLKVPQNILSQFKNKAKLSGVAYQTQIKKLMQDWVLGRQNLD